MGLISFLTADTEESIAIKDSNHKNAGRTVFMLQPTPLPPFVEDNYEGYGNFGGASAYEWLALMNFSTEEIRYFGKDKLHSAGVALFMGDYYEDKDDKERYSYHYSKIHPSLIGFTGNYGDGIPKYNGLTPNQLIASGQWKAIPIKNLFNYQYPLKFSFDENAVYENLAESYSCPYQGWFYEDQYEYLWLFNGEPFGDSHYTEDEISDLYYTVIGDFEKIEGSEREIND